MKHTITCNECEGEGVVSMSCCGDNMLYADIDICPTCGEHCGMEEEECEECEGEGVIPISIHKKDEGGEG